MAHNIVEFWAHHENVPAADQFTALPRQPFGTTIATGSAMGLEVTFVGTGYDGSTTYLGIDRWLLAVRYSATNTAGSTSAHKTASRDGSSGVAAMLLSYANIQVSGGTPSLLWRPYTAGLRWTIRGHLWVNSAA